MPPAPWNFVRRQTAPLSFLQMRVHQMRRWWRQTPERRTRRKAAGKRTRNRSPAQRKPRGCWTGLRSGFPGRFGSGGRVQSGQGAGPRLRCRVRVPKPRRGQPMLQPRPGWKRCPPARLMSGRILLALKRLNPERIQRLPARKRAERIRCLPTQTASRPPKYFFPAPRFRWVPPALMARHFFRPRRFVEERQGKSWRKAYHPAKQWGAWKLCHLGARRGLGPELMGKLFPVSRLNRPEPGTGLRKSREKCWMMIRRRQIQVWRPPFPPQCPFLIAWERFPRRRRGRALVPEPHVPLFHVQV